MCTVARVLTNSVFGSPIVVQQYAVQQFPYIRICIGQTIQWFNYIYIPSNLLNEIFAVNTAIRFMLSGRTIYAAQYSVRRRI